jgi:hypothetical protein
MAAEREKRKMQSTKQVLAEQQNVQIPAEWQAEAERFREAVAANLRPTLLGHLLKFKKGDWVFGENKGKIAPGTRFVAIMAEARYGWVKFQKGDGDEKTVITHIVGKIVEGFKPPERDTLDCQDAEDWKVGLSGKPEDPWQPVCYLPLVSSDGEQLMTFATSSKTGRPVFWKLMDRYTWLGRKHPGHTRSSRSASAGTTTSASAGSPRRSSRSWAGPGRLDLEQLTGGNGDGDATAAESSLRDDLNDELPY